MDILIQEYTKFIEILKKDQTFDIHAFWILPVCFIWTIFFVLLIIPIILGLLVITIVIFFTAQVSSFFYINIHSFLIAYTFDNGYVTIHEWLTRNDKFPIHKINENYRLNEAIKLDKVLYINESLKRYDSKDIYKWLIQRRIVYPRDKTNYYLVKHFLKNYAIPEFMKKIKSLDYAMKDILSLIYEKYFLLLNKRSYRYRTFNLRI